MWTNWVSFVLTVALLSTQGCLNLGCSVPANPVTKFGFDPWTKDFYVLDTKDNDLTVKNFLLEKGPDTAKVTFDEAAFVNNASRVREANVQQIAAYTDQVKAVTGMFEVMTQAISAMLPMVSHTASQYGAPPGWTPTSQPADLQPMSTQLTPEQVAKLLLLLKE